MRRARLKIALIVLVLSGLTGIGFLIGQTMIQQQRVAERTEATMLSPDIAQSIREFRRVKVEEGRTVWDLQADKADFLDEGRVVVEVPRVSFFADDGQSVALSGKTGEVRLEGQEVGRIDLAGGIEVTVGQYRLQTPSASWVGRSNRVIATAGVDLRGGGVEITGERMVVDLGTRSVVFMNDVRTVLTRTESTAEGSREAGPRPGESGVGGESSVGGPVANGPGEAPPAGDATAASEPGGEAAGGGTQVPSARGGSPEPVPDALPEGDAVSQEAPHAS